MQPSHLLERIERLNEIGIALSAEKDLDRLLELVLEGAKTVTGADGGTLYLREDNQTIRMAVVRTDSLDFAMGGTTGEPVAFSAFPLYDDEGTPNNGTVVTHAVHHRQTVNIADVYDADGFDFSGPREFDQKTGYRSRSFLTVPMEDHEGEVIGVLQLINALDPDSGEVIPFDRDRQRLAESLASQAAVALTNRHLLDDLRRLFDAFIQLIASAIDEKSPYTGGHCRRVPVLTMMLADAAHAADSGPFRDFSLDSDERYQLEVAAWLHDCGKITTPEHVVDKSTKLEALHDRIHEVDTRFAVRRQQAEAAALRRRLAELGEPDFDPAADPRYRQEIEALTAERDFVHRCNEGGEAMSEADREELAALAGRCWLDSDGRERPQLTDEELYNLGIGRGTLTPEERQVINNHVSLTIQMLEALPFPKHLRRVPEYAGGHHERMDGKGYPRGLCGEEMPIPARIMAIADVFEALTAKDRPYKPGRSVSAAVAILRRMGEEGHLDPDLLQLFIEQGLHYRYGREYLDPEQLDVEPEERAARA